MTAVDSGHTAWILISMALVQFMLPGLAFFYAGLLHRRSVITMIMQNFASMGVIFVLWFFIVFSLCFGETWHFFGSILTYPCFLNVDGAPLERGDDVVVSDIPGLVFAAYQGARMPRVHPSLLGFTPCTDPVLCAHQACSPLSRRLS